MCLDAFEIKKNFKIDSLTSAATHADLMYMDVLFYGPLIQGPTSLSIRCMVLGVTTVLLLIRIVP